MKFFSLILFITLILFGCSALKYGIGELPKKPGHHIVNKNKSSVKENTKHRKEHAQTAQKKRDEFASYETETHPDQFNKKKKNQRR